MKQQAKQAQHPRPFVTAYYAGVKDQESAFTVLGHAASLRGAKRAAFTRLLDRKAAKALVHDEDGVVVARVWRERSRIVAVGV